MERKIYLTFIFLLFFSYINAQRDYKTEIYNCYLSNEMEDWKKIIDEIEESTILTSFETLQLLNYQYGYIAWCLGNDKENEAEFYLDLAFKNVELLEERNYEISLLNAYKSALYGFSIGLAPYKAPFLGPKSSSFAEKSIELDKNNSFGYLQLGNIEFYMPESFGGSKELALEYFLKSEALNVEKSNNWTYLSILVIIAQTYEKTGKYNEAQNYYKKILEIEPNFNWVKNELLPELNKKMEKDE